MISAARRHGERAAPPRQRLGLIADERPAIGRGVVDGGRHAVLGERHLAAAAHRQEDDAIAGDEGGVGTSGSDGEG